MHQIIEHLSNSRQILLTSHVRPDGDALGAMISMGLALTALGKHVTLYNEDEVPKTFRFLPSSDTVVQHIDRFAAFDTAVVLDCGSLERVGDKATDIGRIPVVINIDHHITNTGFGKYKIVDPSACATSEIVYRVIKQAGITLNRAMAFSIYTGIMTDTGSFRYSNTNREAFAICEEMVGLGVDPNFVASHVSVAYSLSRIKLLNMVLESIEVSDNGKLSIMALTQEMLNKTGSKPEDLGRLINYARQIEDVKVAALIFESQNGCTDLPESSHQFHISLRSDGSVDVAGIAAAYGGGGHKSAAGFNVVSSLSEIKAEILNLADSF
ncbi:MAG: bifunctional oligoribonuclease/PAP phosphatase NrnA [Desulfobacterales bacterium]